MAHRVRSHRLGSPSSPPVRLLLPLFLLLSLPAIAQPVPAHRLVRNVLLADSTRHEVILVRLSDRTSRFLFADGTDRTVSNDSILETYILWPEMLTIRIDDTVRLTGRLRGVDEESITFYWDEAGELNIPIDRIGGFALVEPVPDPPDSSDYHNPMTRMLLFPTAVPLEPGAFEFSMVQIIFPQIAAGITERIGIRTGGFVIGLDPTLWPLFLGLQGTPLHMEELDFSVGAGGFVYNRSFNEAVFSDPTFSPLAYGLTTFRWDRSAVTIGYYNVFDNGTPGALFEGFTVGGIFGISENYSLVSENWRVRINEDNRWVYTFSFGFQHSNGERTVALGLMGGAGEDGFLFPLPVLSFTL